VPKKRGGKGGKGGSGKGASGSKGASGGNGGKGAGGGKGTSGGKSNKAKATVFTVRRPGGGSTQLRKTATTSRSSDVFTDGMVKDGDVVRVSSRTGEFAWVVTDAAQGSPKEGFIQAVYLASAPTKADAVQGTQKEGFIQKAKAYLASTPTTATCQAAVPPMPPAAGQVPHYWSMRNLSHKTRRVEITGTPFLDTGVAARDVMQELVDSTCTAATLGTGRDMKFKMTYTKLAVAKVWRIEQPALWEVYTARRAAIRRQLHPLGRSVPSIGVKSSAPWQRSLALQGAVNESYLFHGTKPELLATIQEHGFDERVGALGGMFGAGVYFAEASSKSDQYCTTEDSSGNESSYRFYMFLSRVCLGYPHKTTVPMHQIRRPPTMDGVLDGRAHDSVVYEPTTGHNYNEYIVYDRSATYPEYLIEFNRN
jgi:hypothetical protein